MSESDEDEEWEWENILSGFLALVGRALRLGHRERLAELLGAAEALGLGDDPLVQQLRGRVTELRRQPGVF